MLCIHERNVIPSDFAIRCWPHCSSQHFSYQPFPHHRLRRHKKRASQPLPGIPEYLVRQSAGAGLSSVENHGRPPCSRLGRGAARSTSAARTMESMCCFITCSMSPRRSSLALHSSGGKQAVFDYGSSRPKIRRSIVPCRRVFRGSVVHQMWMRDMTKCFLADTIGMCIANSGT